ncbi:MAG: 30S ribosomal protein S16 [candidate division Zixibacteria bacterium]|nr:30S ribosomal protein S16 [candidate division Zixibacteria bacterium]
MAVHIRLRRMGKKKQPFYRIVAADHRRARDGRFIEILGTYNPMTVPAKVTLFEDKVTKWLNEGAEPSDTVSTLFTQIGFTEKYLKLKKGEDVSAIEIRTEITERRKKTKGMKKAVAAEAEAKKAKAEEASAKPAAEDAAPAEEAATAEDATPAEKADSKEKDKE